MKSDPQSSNRYFNRSLGEDYIGLWNQGNSPRTDKEWQLIDNTNEHVQQTKGLLQEKTEDTPKTEKSTQKHNKALRVERRAEVDEATLPENGIMSWSVYEEE